MTDIASLNIRINTLEAKAAKQDLNRLTGAGQKAERQMETMSKAAARLGTALAAAFATQQVVSRSLAAFSVFDKGLIGVQKTTGMTDAQIKSLGVSISEMSLRLPVSTSRLLELAEAAGQLGVTGSKNIEIFTETMAKLETASDVAGEEGAKAIARLLNVTGEAINTVPRFGSVLVALGNASAASEKEILSLASEIGQATSVFSVTAADAAALGAAMRSIGVRAELGGSSVGRAMRTIEAAIHAGGDEMKLLMDVTQMTEKQLRETFERNATVVFQKWIEGIGRLVGGGRTAASVLEDFGLKGEEVLKILPAMAQNSQLLADSLAISNAEVENATALNEEAMAASKSFSAQMGMAKNAVDLIAASIGAGLAPAIIDVVRDFRDWVDANDEFIRQGVPALVGETAEKLAQVQPLVEGAATATWRMVDGFLSLPTWVQSVGIISAFFFGKKAAVVLAALSAAIGQLNELNKQFDAIPQSSKLEALIEREKIAIEKLNKQYKDLRGSDKNKFGQNILNHIAEREERLQGYVEMLEKAKKATDASVPDPKPYKDAYAEGIAARQAQLDEMRAAEQEIADLVAKIAAPGIKLDEERAKATAKISDEYKKLTMSTRDYGKLKLEEWFKAEAKAAGGVSKELQKLYELKLELIGLEEKGRRVSQAGKDLDAFFGETAGPALDDYDKKLSAAKAFEEKIYTLQFTSKENEIRLKEEALEAYSKLESAKVEVVAAAQADIYKTIHAQISALSETTFDGTSFGNELADGINEAVISMKDLNKMYEKQAKVQADLVSLRKKANTTEDIEERAKMLGEIGKVEAQLIEDQVSGYRQMFGTTAQLFKENSKERQIMHNAELAFAAIEIGMNLQKAISNAVVAVTGAGDGDPYTAIPRVLAMAALMGGILSQIGGSLSAGGGGSKVPVKAENMTGTVLGYSGQASESLANIESFFEDMHLDEYTELQGIHDEVKSLNRNISGLVSNIFRSGMGFAPGDMGINTDFKISPAEKLIDNIVIKTFKDIPVLDSVSVGLGKVVNKVVGKVFGGSVKTTVESQGLTTAGGISIDDLMGGSSIGTTQYADIKKKKDGGWFRSDKTSYYTEYQAVDEDVDRLFTQIFTSVGETFVDLAKIVGQDAMTVKDYVFEIGKIDLKNLTDADEISGALEAAFSGISDKAATDLFREVVGQYQAVGEGMMETVVRVASEKIIVLDTVSKLGNAFEDADMPALAIEFSQSLLDIAGGLENFMETTGNYYNKFFSDEEKHTDITKSLEKAFTNLDIDFPNSRDAFRDIVEGIDIVTESGQKAFVTMMNLSDSADKYYSYIEAAEKKRDELKNTYLDYLQEEIDIRQTAFDNAKNVLEGYIAGEERLIDARRQAAKSIDDFINGLMGSPQAPVQSLEFFEKRYAQLLSDAQTAGPDDIGNAVSALTSFTSQYLDFAGAYGGQDYNTLFNSVVSDLESVGADQLDQADVQTRALRDIKDLIGDTDGKLFDLNEAVQSFVDAKIGLDESAWMVQELNSLASIDSNLLLLYDAQRAYYGKVDTSKEPPTPAPEMDYVQYLYSTIGRAGFGSDMNQIDPEGYQYWSKASKTMSPEELSKAFYNAVDEYIAQNPDDPYTQFVSPYMGYADGGIISGPTSGYQLPGATFHGTEAIVPLKNGSIPVEIRSGNQDIRVVVKIGNRELKDITTEIIRTDPEAQGQIRRVANG